MAKVKWRLKNKISGDIIEISKPIFKVGRSAEADLKTVQTAVSRNHATLSILLEGLLYVQDNKSCNGTYLNNHRITDIVPLKNGDIIGFGYCQRMCQSQQSQTAPLVFEVLSDEAGEQQQSNVSDSDNFKTPENKEHVSLKEEPLESSQCYSVEDDDCILISDGEDENLFACSQIIEISEKIKKEQISCGEINDPYLEIKQELKELDYCEIINNVPVDLTIDNEHFSNTMDLLNVLEDSFHSDGNDHLEKENICNTDTVVSSSISPQPKFDDEFHADKAEPASLSKSEFKDEIFAEKVNQNNEKSKYTKPPIIEPHFISKPSCSKEINQDNKDTSSKKSTPKRKSTENISVSQKKSKTSSTVLKCDIKTIRSELKNRNIINRNEIDKGSKEKILTERRKRLKEISEKDKNCREEFTKPNSASKVKISGGRGNFLLETVSLSSSSITRKNNEYNHASSTSKYSATTNMEVDKLKHSAHKTKYDSVQDTTISSNFSPNSNESIVLQNVPMTLPKVTSNYNNTTHLWQGPDSTINENRSGLIWKISANRPSSHVLNFNRANENMDDEIYTIVHWSVKWLMEQNNCEVSPPVNGNNILVKMPQFFKDYSEYVKIVPSLIMLELWQYIYQTVYNKDEDREPVSVSFKSYRRTEKFLYLECECYVSDQDIKNNKTFRQDDFALIELKVKDSKVYQYTGFGYIVASSRKTTSENNGFQQYPNVAFTLITRKLVDKEIFGKQILVKVIGNVASSFRLFKTVKYLQVSTICKQILRPQISDYKVSIEDKHVIIEFKLNDSQKKIVLEACSLCLKENPGLYLIKGPPGTGKSTVIINIVLQILLKSQKVGQSPLILLTAPSNTAVDGLILKLAEIRVKLPDSQKKLLKIVRIGPDSSISKEVDKFKLSTLARNTVLKESKLIALSEYKKTLEKGLDIDQFVKNQLGQNYYYEMKQAEDRLILCSNVICTTLNSCVGYKILHPTRRGQLKFSCCIIDESTQCNEVECLLPILLGIDKFVLVGDPKQLPAVVCNKDAVKLGYGKSLFSRIDENLQKETNKQANSTIKMLYEQYRMKPEICEYPNKTFYGGKLKSTPLHVNKIEPLLRPYLLFNLLHTENGVSDYINNDEVIFICNLLNMLKNNIKKSCKYTIGIITPYRAQTDLLKKSIFGVNGIRFHQGVTITVNTVDSFQGMEDDIVIISCVRYSPNSFLQNEQRLNVAITRAKQALYIIGNYTLFTHCRLLCDLREDAKKRKLCFDIKDDPKSITNFENYILLQA